MDDYTTKFYQLIARNEIQEMEDQLVSRYIGGLKIQIQDTVNKFDPVSIFAAHQRVLMVEKWSRYVANTVSMSTDASSTGGANKIISNNSGSSSNKGAG